jgi:hypothetical protein
MWGRVLLDAGRRRAAVDCFDAALQIYNRISAGQPWLEHGLFQSSPVANDGCNG